MTNPIESDVPETTDAPVEGKKLSYEDLQAELSRVRNEAASRRIANRELEEQAEKWKQYEDSQKTELQKLQDELAKRDKDLAGYQLNEKRSAVAKEFGLESGDESLLTGSDEATIRSQAERLKARLGSTPEAPKRPVDLLAGNRGTPIGVDSTDPMEDAIRNALKR
jgi:hypothetical protein